MLISTRTPFTAYARQCLSYVCFPVFILLAMCLIPQKSHALILSSPENIKVTTEQLTPDSRHRSLSQVRQATHALWTPRSDQLLNLSLDAREHWFRIRIEQQSSKREHLILLLDQPLQDYIDLWLVQNGDLLQLYELGDHRPYSNRVDSYRGYGIPLDLTPGEPLTLYLRMDTFDGLHEVTPAFLLKPEQYHQRLVNDSLWYGIYYGAILLLIAYNLVIGLMTRERDFFLYSLYLTGFMAWNLIFRGYGHQLWPDSSWISNHGLVISSCLLLIGLYFFSGSFLKFKDDSPKLYPVIRLLTLYQLIPAGLALSGKYSLAFLFFFPGAAGLMLTVLSTAVLLSRKGDRSARTFVLAWIILLIATLIYFCQVVGLIPANIITINSINIGSLIEMLVLALALVDKINQLKQEQAEALRENLQLQQKNNIELEQLVAEKTAQLTELNKQLEHESVTDTLTGLYNRRRLPQRFKDKLSLCQQSHRPIALVLLDIDHFKQVNDRFGHQDGDRVLAALAEKMRTFWLDWEADLFRFGGEEFGIIVCHQDKKTLTEHIHQFQKRIACEQLHPNCHITLSAGAVVLPSSGESEHTCSLDSAIAQADNLLYEAKNRGRNLCLIRDFKVPPSLQRPESPSTA